MSSNNLKSATRQIVQRAKARKGRNIAARSDAIKDPGQLFVINMEQEAVLVEAATGLKLSTPEKRKLFALELKFLRGLEQAGYRTFSKEQIAQLKPLKQFAKKDPNDHVFVVASYNSFKGLAKYRARNKNDLSQIKANFVNTLERRERNYSAKEMSAVSHLGHGEQGIPVSQFALEREIDQAAKDFGLSAREVDQLYSIVYRQREKHDIKVGAFHTQSISATRIDKKFTFVLTNQLAGGNIGDSQLEKLAFQESLAEFEELTFAENSTALDEAVLIVFTDKIAPKKAKTSKKRKKTINERSQARHNDKYTTTDKHMYQVQRGVPMKKPAGEKAKKSIFSDMTLIGLLNAKLPQQVAENMGEPRLTNRTGRFASSVRATDVTRTARGMPSVGYTYQRNPYETFEVGGKRGSPEYDPRKLIDLSIRQIAATVAKGRFYTRRL